MGGAVEEDTLAYRSRLCLACLLWALCAPLNGCGDTPAAVPDLDGIYLIESYRINDSDCEGPGDDRLAALGVDHIVVLTHTVVGIQMTRLIGCTDVADCETAREAVLAMDTSRLTGFNFSFSQRSNSGLLGIAQSTGYTSAEGICKAPARIVSRLTRQGQGGVAFVSETTLGADYPADDDGYCTTELGTLATEGAPCQSVVFMTARPAQSAD